MGLMPLMQAFAGLPVHLGLICARGEYCGNFSSVLFDVAHGEEVMRKAVELFGGE